MWYAYLSSIQRNPQVLIKLSILIGHKFLLTTMGKEKSINMINHAAFLYSSTVSQYLANIYIFHVYNVLVNSSGIITSCIYTLGRWGHVPDLYKPKERLCNTTMWPCRIMLLMCKKNIRRKKRVSFLPCGYEVDWTHFFVVLNLLINYLVGRQQKFNKFD